MLYTVYKKTPGIDIDVMWDMYLEDGYMETMEEAAEMARNLEKDFESPLWEGHPNYRSKFYAAPITKEEVNRNWRSWGYANMPV